MSSSSTVNGSAQKLSLPVRLRFGNNCETFPGPIAENEKIPIGFRNLTFQEIVTGHDKLLRQGIDKYGSRKVSYEDNLHHARLALWNTIVFGATYREFRDRFFKEMKRAVRNDEYGMGYPEKKALRLDNSRNNWHDAIPDRKASLNLHLMGKPAGKRFHYQIRERADPRIARREARRRHRALLRARTEAFWAANGERIEELKQERIERAHLFYTMVLTHMSSIEKSAVCDPFLMKPSMVLNVISQRAKIQNSYYMVLRPSPKVIKIVRLLMGRVAPAVPSELERFEPVPLKDEDYKKVKEQISQLIDYYRDETRGIFGHVVEYLNALNAEITLQTALPLEIKSDLKKIKIIEKETEYTEREYDPVF